VRTSVIKEHLQNEEWNHHTRAEGTALWPAAWERLDLRRNLVQSFRDRCFGFDNRARSWYQENRSGDTDSFPTRVCLSVINWWKRRRIMFTRLHDQCGSGCLTRSQYDGP
jgi:hypothetical protein